MMRSMYSGVAGLKTHQTKMDVIGNNIANVNTVAYKAQSVTFSELMYQTTQSASGPNAITGTGGINARQIGLGVKAGAINTNISTQGASQTTNNPFDIQITGNAFFVVSNGSENFFTRDGSFYVDGAGNLAMTSNGYNVMGWGVDPETMDIKPDTVQPLRIMSPDNLTYEPEATSKAYLSGIIDKNDTSVTSSSGKNINLQIYDKLGYSYTVRLNIKSTDIPGEYGLSLGDILDVNNESIFSDAVPKVDFGTKGQRLERETPISLKTGYSWNNDGSKLICANPAAEYAVTAIETAVGNVEGGSTDEADLKVVKALLDAYNLNDISDSDKYTFKFENYGGETNEGNISLRKVIFNTDITFSSTNTATPPVTADKTVKAQEILIARDEIDATAANKNAQLLGNLTADATTIDGFIIQYDPTTGVFSGIDDIITDNIIELNLGNITVTTPNGEESKFSNIEIDLSTTNMYNNSGSSTISATSGDLDGLGSGRKLGEMSGISVQQNGMIYASYDNGQTKLLGQIAVAEFSNASGLEKEGDNLYSATLNSGEFDGIGVDITSSGGYMNTGVLEMSNVDLSAEFTEMITTQRGFQANSRIITVSDTLLEELVNLKR